MSMCRDVVSVAPGVQWCRTCSVLYLDRDLAKREAFKVSDERGVPPYDAFGIAIGAAIALALEAGVPTNDIRGILFT